MLTIICKDYNKYIKSINAICRHVGIIDYEVIDPDYHNVKTHYNVVLKLGVELNVICNKEFKTGLPDHALDLQEKRKQIDVYKEAKEYLETSRDRTEFKKIDIPELSSLDKYLNDLNGRVVEMKLKDRRRVGIYPDGQKLENIYDIEYHASTIVNIVKLFETFNASEILIKEL